MIKIEFCLNTGKYTLIGLDSPIPASWKSSDVSIAGKQYKTEVVYDLPNHIAIVGNGEFKGEEIQFL